MFALLALIPFNFGMLPAALAEIAFGSYFLFINPQASSAQLLEILAFALAF